MSSLPLERPTRADARRNYELLLTAARQAFLEHGSDASLEEIARRAGVGIGTLYRRFPNRQALLEAVYVEEIQSMCEGAKVLAELPPWDAVVAWLRDFVDFGLTKSAVASELIQSLGKDSEFFAVCKTTIMDTATLIIARGVEAGVVRRDVQPLDVLKLVGGIAHTNNDDPAQAYRMLDVVLEGLRARH
ncbi:MAG: TetR/AcrR family transcriptional regulator [Kribbellaceae bacterium]